MNEIETDGDELYDDGQWVIGTMGFFIGLMVDAGHDPAVAFRVVADSEPDENGQFRRHLEVTALPDGHVGAWIEGHESAGTPVRIHKTLAALLKGGVVR